MLWHQSLGIWGAFGKTPGGGDVARDWNAFGQKPFGFQKNTAVQINPPNYGININLQGIFARNNMGKLWLMHQGRMNVPAKRITEADFILLTQLFPDTVQFSNSSTEKYHKVAWVYGPPTVLQNGIAAFIAKCAQARLAKILGNKLVTDQKQLEDWERGLSPEMTGAFAIAAREAAFGRRIHGEVWRALANELTRRNVPHSNDRIGQYGPDLFTYGVGPRILFEIKSHSGAQEIFSAVGQLQIYEKLLGKSYRKIFVHRKG